MHLCAMGVNKALERFTSLNTIIPLLPIFFYFTLKITKGFVTFVWKESN